MTATGGLAATFAATSASPGARPRAVTATVTTAALTAASAATGVLPVGAAVRGAPSTVSSPAPTRGFRPVLLLRRGRGGV